MDRLHWIALLQCIDRISSPDDLDRHWVSIAQALQLVLCCLQLGSELIEGLVTFAPA
jgi:hypothetical protein